MRVLGFWPTMQGRFSAVMLMGKEGRVVVVWFAKVEILLKLKSGKGDEAREVAIMQYIEITAPLDAVE